MEAKEPKASPELLKAFKDLGVPKTPQPDLSAELRKMAADIVKPVFWPNSPASDAERRHANAMLKAADRIESDAALLASERAAHEKFVADVLHLRGEIEWLGVENDKLTARVRELEAALRNLCGDVEALSDIQRPPNKHALISLETARDLLGPSPRMTT